MTIDSRFVRERRTSRNKMRHSQLEGQRHLEAGGKNEGEEMSQGNALGHFRSRDFFPQPKGGAVPRDGAMPGIFFWDVRRDMTNKGKSVVFLPIPAAIPLLFSARQTGAK